MNNIDFMPCMLDKGKIVLCLLLLFLTKNMIEKFMEKCRYYSRSHGFEEYYGIVKVEDVIY